MVLLFIYVLQAVSFTFLTQEAAHSPQGLAASLFLGDNALPAGLDSAGQGSSHRSTLCHRCTDEANKSRREWLGCEAGRG